MTSSVSSSATRAVLTGELARLVTYSPDGDPRLTTLVRRACATALSLPPLPVEVDAEAETESERVVVEFVEQFSTDVSALSPELRGSFLAARGRKAFTVSALVFIADSCRGSGPASMRSGWSGRRLPSDGITREIPVRRSSTIRTRRGPTPRPGPGDHRSDPVARRGATQLPAVPVTS